MISRLSGVRPQRAAVAGFKPRNGSGKVGGSTGRLTLWEVIKMSKKSKKSGKSKKASAAPKPLQRYADPANVAAWKADGWKEVAGATPLRNGSVLMEKRVG